MNTTPEIVARWAAQIAEWRYAGPEYVIAVRPPDLLALLEDIAEIAAEARKNGGGRRAAGEEGAP